MKNTLFALLFALLSALEVAGTAPSAMAGTPEELMTKGKLAADPAVAGVAPDPARWASQWPKVRLSTNSGSPDPHPSIAWPGGVPA